MILAPFLLAAASAPNVVLVTIDTLRADHVGAYGYRAGETATLDRLAREGVLVEEAVVQVPQTRPSHATIMTGLYPPIHGVRDNIVTRNVNFEAGKGAESHEDVRG